jgi:hypothetical protein
MYRVLFWAYNGLRIKKRGNNMNGMIDFNVDFNQSKPGVDDAIPFTEVAAEMNISYATKLSFNLKTGECTVTYINKVDKAFPAFISGMLYSYIKAGVRLGGGGRNGPAVSYKG